MHWWRAKGWYFSEDKIIKHANKSINLIEKKRKKIKTQITIFSFFFPHIFRYLLCLHNKWTLLMKRQNDIDIKVPTLMHTYHLEKYLALVILAAAKILKRNASILLNLRSEEAINLLFFQINCKSRCAQRNTNRRMDPSKLIKYLNIQDISA